MFANRVKLFIFGCTHMDFDLHFCLCLLNLLLVICLQLNNEKMQRLYRSGFGLSENTRFL